MSKITIYYSKMRCYFTNEPGKYSPSWDFMIIGGDELACMYLHRILDAGVIYQCYQKGVYKQS